MYKKKGQLGNGNFMNTKVKLKLDILPNAKDNEKTSFGKSI